MAGRRTWGRSSRTPTGEITVEIHWTCIGCDPEAERAIERLWEDLQTSVESRIAAVPAEPSDLRAVVEHDTDSDEWRFYIALLSPARNFAAEASAAELESAIEKGFARLVERIDRRSDQREEISRQRQGLHAVVPILERYRQAGRSDAFFIFLGPVVRSLRSHVRRELDILQSDELITGTAPLAAELLDEVAVRAWERFPERPENLSLDGWLLRLLDEVIGELVSGHVLRSLDEPVLARRSHSEEGLSEDEWIEEVDAPDIAKLGDLFEAHPGADVWDRLDDEAKQSGLARLLAALPRQQRQALVLGAVEGFEVEEIAGIQDRSAREVQADLDEARKALSHELNAQDFWEVQDEIEHPGGRDRRRRRR